MAYVSERGRGKGPVDEWGQPPARRKKPVGRIVVPALGIAFGLWAAATVTNIYSSGDATAAVEALPARHITAQTSIALIDSMRKVKWVSASLVPSGEEYSRDRFWLLHDDCGTRCVPAADGVARLPQPGLGNPRGKAGVELASRFDSVVAHAELTTDKLAALFGKPPVEKETVEVRVASLDAGRPVASALEVLKEAPAMRAPSADRFERTLVEAVKASEEDGPAAERFAPVLAERERSYSLAMAYLETLPAEDAQEVVVASLDEVDSETLALGVPDSAPLPDRRPKREPRAEPAPARTASRNAGGDEKASKEVLAFAKPDNPSGGLGQAFRDLFSGPNNPGDGTAIYDIAAATVYMPDGSKLKAHSGLGHMVDDPRYVDKKMRGPTPPNTYKLVMRESRFHGVEAIRMLPVGDKKMYGRNGILAHTYMLRGGLAQSNGCLVFKHYDRFLRAFKKGHIKRIVVVPGRSRSRSVQTASNGRDA